jgi:hypothetical protein
MVKRTAELDDEYNKTNAEKLQLMEQSSNVKVISGIQGVKLQTLRDDIVALDKDTEKEKTREVSLQSMFGFTASDSIATQLREKEVATESAKSETTRIRADLSEVDPGKYKVIKSRSY